MSNTLHGHFRYKTEDMLYLDLDIAQSPTSFSFLKGLHVEKI
jgi:hypothetical protein